VALAERFEEAARGLPRGWERARVEVTLEDADQADRAALILAPASPGRSGTIFRFQVHSGAQQLAPTPEMVRRALARLDAAGIRGRLRLVGHEQAAETSPTPARTSGRRPLAAYWDDLLRRLPTDWSDLYGEVELDSTDYLERGALLLAPVNPARHGASAAFRFRVARDKGYGVAPVMARRCLERLDQEGITGRVRALRVLSGTHLAATQGPVWLVGGRSV
jgi:hypothetical protein